MDLQELIARGRFVLANAPSRIRVYSLVNGRNTASTIAKKTRRHRTHILNDLQKLRDVGLIEPKLDRKGNTVRVQEYLVYQKVPLARHIPLTYFQGPAKTRIPSSAPVSSKTAGRQAKAKALPIPKEKDILDICRHGEDQTYEFKGAGVEVKKITREIAAFLNTRQGGIVFYGVEDDGTIAGTDRSRQKLDQAVQNSVRDSIAPPANIHLRSTKVLGTEIILIIIPPWNRRDVYTYDDRVLIRKGTNVFVAKHEETKKLHRGITVI
ncbi:ATP-binding protein [Nitrospiraceae bacterium AH_259_D15_M11_P09]|nr:ATP-binding protein [Nitrospiraceae bacterium AH_259_D15_M11_P09]